MNKDKYLIYVLIGGVVFLVFYWTNSFFDNKITESKASLADVKAKTEKAAGLYVKSLAVSDLKPPVDSGLMSFVEGTSKGLGLSDRLGDIKPKDVPSGEGASFTISSITASEMSAFLKEMESHKNISVTSVKISKRFDNEKRLNMYLEVSKS